MQSKFKLKSWNVIRVIIKGLKQIGLVYHPKNLSVIGTMADKPNK